MQDDHTWAETVGPNSTNRSSCRNRTVNCLRTSIRVAVGRLEKSSEHTRNTSCDTRSGAKPQPLQGPS